jgi:type-F conjugative transfer system pilin assembly protein TrbC
LFSRSYLIALSLCASLLGADSNQTAKNQQEFMDKYRLNEKGKQAIEGFTIPDISHSEYQGIKDINISAFEQNEFNVTRLKQDMNRSNKDAQAVFKNFSSKEGERKIDEQTRFILKDEAFGARQYAGEYRDIIDDRLNDPNNPVLSSVPINNGNKFLDKNEQVIVVISSSIPASTLRSYFQDIDAIEAISDVKFVLRDLVGNDVSTIKPTIEYLSTIVSKSGKPVKSENNETYKISVSINPKITQKYGIDRVPAVIFIKNYNAAIEEPKRIEEAIGENEEYYIAYGAAKLDYSLTKINEKAKSEGLKRLINALQKQGFFNDEIKKKQ